MEKLSLRFAPCYGVRLLYKRSPVQIQPTSFLDFYIRDPEKKQVTIATDDSTTKISPEHEKAKPHSK